MNSSCTKSIQTKPLWWSMWAFILDKSICGRGECCLDLCFFRKSLLMAKELKSKAWDYMNTVKHPTKASPHCTDSYSCSANKQSTGQIQVKTLPKRHILGFSSRSATYYMIQYLVPRFWNRLDYHFSVHYGKNKSDTTLLCDLRQLT